MTYIPALRLLLVPAMAGLLIGPAHADETCNLDIRSNYRTLVGAQSGSRQWVEFRRTDIAEPGSRTIVKDEAVFAADFQRVYESNAMQAPNDFTFRSGWVLNSQFAFRQGETLPVKTVYHLPSGERFYALQPTSKPNLTIFAKPNGTLCNKVMNTTLEDDHVFLIKEYKTRPATRLATATPHVGARAPLTLRIIYLGASGGIPTFRTLWSQEGLILQNEELQYEQSATHLQIAGLEIPVSNMTAGSVTVGDIPLTDRIAWGAYWTRWFRD